MTIKTQKYPTVTLGGVNPTRDLYTDDSVGEWRVARLIDLANGLPVFKAPLAAMDLSAEVWAGASIVDLAYHVRRVNSVDLEKPVILGGEGEIMDGRHRIIKALTEGRPAVLAVRFETTPEPCRRYGQDG